MNKYYFLKQKKKGKKMKYELGSGQEICIDHLLYNRHWVK